MTQQSEPMDIELEKVKSRVADFRRALGYAIQDRLPDGIHTETLEKLRTEFHAMLADVYRIVARGKQR